MFDMSLEKDLVTVNGRVEVAEQIMFGGNGTTKKTHDWTRDLRGKPLLTPKILDYWVVLVPTQLHADTMSFITAGLQVAASGMNFNMHDPQMYVHKSIPIQMFVSLASITLTVFSVLKCSQGMLENIQKC